MKNLLKLILFTLFFLNVFSINAQEETLDHNYFQLSPRIGVDFPTYKNNTPYIDYKGGIELGLSLDFYWNWLGLGFDFDYINNKPKSTYPAIPSLMTTVSEKKITRIFYGIGPDVQFTNKTGKFKTEINTRFGFSSIKGGRVLLEDLSSNMLNFHAGYNDKNIFSFKGQLRFTYYINKNFGFNVGAYYLKHFGVTELSEMGISSGYQPFTDLDGEIFLSQGGPEVREEPCNCDISSVGIFTGVTIKFSKKENICPICKEDHMPHCCAICGCAITVTSKDKFTGDILPNTDVVLTDLNDNIVQSGTTNSYGVVVFKDVESNNYIVKGKLYNINLEETNIEISNFIDCLKNGSAIQKEILYGDSNFILKGNVVECNTPNSIQGVDVLLKDKIQAGQKNTLSDIEGNFIFHLKQASTYELSGKKDGYYSNIIEVSTGSYNRNTTLFIDFEMCVDPCGKAIKLDNINFDLDKAIILPNAIPDLQRVVNLMKDNPNIQVEMSSHTDSQGSDSYNQDLSQRRADATVNYIVSQGISRSRLIARGAGETELKNTKCANNVPCTDNEHRINRRTEFKVVCF